MRTFMFFLYFGLFVISHLPKILRLSKLNDEEGIRKRVGYIYSLGDKLLTRLLRIAGAKIEILGRENVPLNESVLFVSNHQSNMDIPILFTTSPNKMSFVAKKEMEKIPALGFVMNASNCLFMDRDNPRESIKTINQGIELLKNGYSLSIFPEGTRSKTNATGEFKPGSLRLAIKSGAKIVPVTIKNSFKLLEGNGNKIKPASIEVHFHEAIDPADYQDTNELNTVVVNKIKSVL